MSARNRNRSPLRLVFKELVLPFFFDRNERWKVLGLSLATISLIFGMVYSLVLMNHWNQAFYDALQRLDQTAFIHQLWVFFIVAFASALATALKFFTLQRLALRWRIWMTEKNLQRWLSDKNYYLWHLEPRGNDNPDQRLSDDIFELSDLTMEIAEKIFREAITFVSFIGILWGLSSSLHFSLLGWNFELHRYLVVICLLYAAVGTWLVHRVGNPLAALHFLQQRFEADFRFLLVRLRENAESVALANGEQREQVTLLDKFRSVAANFKQVLSRQRDIILTNSIYGQFAYIFPFVVSSGKVFTREITLGQLFQISSAFGQVQGSVSVFIDLYAKIARWYSVVVRLGGFLNSLQQNEAWRRRAEAERGTPEAEQRTAQRTATSSLAELLRIHSLTVKTATGSELIRDLSLAMAPGDRLQVTADSGAGKSTLVRTLAGIWPYFEGDVAWLQGLRPMILQQVPYFPTGSLKAAMAYPLSADLFSESQYADALILAGLPELSRLLSGDEPWSQRISTGELQRLAIARVFLQKPTFLLLDEATSALGSQAEAELLSRLIQHLPEITLLTLSHPNSTLAIHHQKTLPLSPSPT